jgi:hypothetical protein
MTNRALANAVQAAAVAEAVSIRVSAEAQSGISLANRAGGPTEGQRQASARLPRNGGLLDAGTDRRGFSERRLPENGECSDDKRDTKA